MPKNLEIEKKFIIKYPDVEFLKSVKGCTYTEIEQIYLESDDGVSERIRKRGLDGKYKYYHTIKYHITDITRYENERLITQKEYDEFKKRADKRLNIIYKTRYCIPYEGHVIEIDVFPFWDRQAYMEVELESEDEIFEVPEFVQCIRDVTTDSKYTNRALASQIPPQI